MRQRGVTALHDRGHPRDRDRCPLSGHVKTLGDLLDAAGRCGVGLTYTLTPHLTRTTGTVTHEADEPLVRPPDHLEVPRLAHRGHLPPTPSTDTAGLDQHVVNAPIDLIQ